MMFYAIPMYAAGITQGLMWKQFNAEGFLQYPNFLLETVLQIIPLYQTPRHRRSLFLVGTVMMVINLYRTAKCWTV